MKEQSFANHARYFPMFHFVAFPILALYMFKTLLDLFRAPGTETMWMAAVAIAILFGVLGSRTMALKVQDRVIRLEMRLRLAEVLPPDLQSVIPGLRAGQLIALRFASDTELPDLVRRATSGDLADQKAIKMAITDWQPDWFRA